MKRKILLSVFAGIVLLFVGCILGFALHLIDMDVFCGPIMVGPQKGVDVTPLYEANVNFENMVNLPDVIDLDKFSYVDFASDNALRGYFTYSSYNSIYVSIIYWEKVEFADSNFDNECENILHRKGSMEYGGEPKNRYCISHVREMRTSTDTFCTPRGEYESFVVFQKERMTILLREVAKSSDVMNKNKVILDIAEALTKSK